MHSHYMIRNNKRWGGGGGGRSIKWLTLQTMVQIVKIKFAILPQCLKRDLAFEEVCSHVEITVETRDAKNNTQRGGGGAY